MILVVVPSASDGAPSVAPTRVVAGLPLITRIVRAARAAGFEQVFVCDMGPAVRGLVDGAGAAVLTPSTHIPPLSRQRIVLVPANVVPQPRWLHALLEMPVEPERLYVDGACAVVVETERPGVVLAAAARSTQPGLVGELARTFGNPPRPLALDGRFPLVSATDVATAETLLLRSLIKHNEGFMSRHFERTISLALTRRLASTSVTPDMMTLTSVAVGLAGAPFFLGEAPALQLTGAMLFLAHSVLDGCDGELARLKFQQSRRGAILDFWGDNTVHVAVFICMAVGWALSARTAWPLVLGAAAALATLGSAALTFERTAELALTRRLASTSVTPDMMTLTSVAVGLAGAPFFLGEAPALQLTGAMLFLAHSVLDGCDGELARLKFQQSRRGAILDFWGDNTVHVAVFICMAVGWALSARTAWPLVLGAAAALATLGSAALTFERTAEDHALGADSPRAARLAAALASRDFIYLVIVLSAFGKASWFLVAAAVGAPAFLLLVVWNRRHGRVR
ncbi:MAG: hypothetical protein AUI18_02960 [Candidatus Rokubacteria bacterium 13_1_40CM_2_70_45]|nr:MAG: hypothetical protein AUI18_02960 [Candidatus Rokubacteria bacterium 13_1_40CM_2_70_45]